MFSISIQRPSGVRDAAFCTDFPTRADARRMFGDIVDNIPSWPTCLGPCGDLYIGYHNVHDNKVRFRRYYRDGGPAVLTREDWYRLRNNFHPQCILKHEECMLYNDIKLRKRRDSLLLHSEAIADALIDLEIKSWYVSENNAETAWLILDHEGMVVAEADRYEDAELICKLFNEQTRSLVAV